MIYAFLVGFLLGALILNMYLRDEQKANENLNKTIDNLEDSLDELEFNIKTKDQRIKELNKEHEILLENASELRTKTNILDEIETIINSDELTFDKYEKIKELVSPQKQN